MSPRSIRRWAVVAVALTVGGAVGAGTALEFRLARPVSVDVLTEVAAAP